MNLSESDLSISIFLENFFGLEPAPSFLVGLKIWIWYQINSKFLDQTVPNWFKSESTIVPNQSEPNHTGPVHMFNGKN